MENKTYPTGATMLPKEEKDKIYRESQNRIKEFNESVVVNIKNEDEVK